MSHLTQEQFEEILQGGGKVPEHMDQCPDCRARLEEKRALAQRVRGAFSTIHAGPDLINRIRADIAAGQAACAERTWPRIIPLRFHRHLWSAIAAAAIILIAFVLTTGRRFKIISSCILGSRESK